MSQVEMNAYEAVLRMCADAAPNAWHPQQYSRRSGTPLEQINAVLKELWQAGLLEKAPAHPDLGPGLRLSAKGWDVLNDPQALSRVREGVTTDDGERGDRVRRALHRKQPSYVGRILIGMNVLVFLYGLYLANQAGIASAYLSGSGAADVLHKIGLITAHDWLHGEWWKTLTACFVHIGALHILMNMYMLYSSGQYIERIWGPLRFLVIYLLAGVTGSMTGLAGNPGGIAGASTALFGIFAAEGVWVLFNGKYLSKQVARDWRNHLLVNALLLVFISFLPGISGWGHAGGAAAGAAAAVCLHYQRFGPPLWRWAALLGLLPIPFAGLYMIDYERHKKGGWQTAEINDFKAGYRHSTEHPLTKEMAAEFKDIVRPVLDMAANRRPDADKEAALAVLEKQHKVLESSRTEVTNLGPYDSKEVKADRQQALDALTARLDLYERAEKSLREGEDYPEKDKKELMELIADTPELRRQDDRPIVVVKKETEEERQEREKLQQAAEAKRKQREEVAKEEKQFNDELLPKISMPLRTADKLYEDDLTALLDRPVAERVPQTLKKNLAAIEEKQKQLQQLAEWLPTLGPFKSEDVTKAIAAARAYVTGLTKLLETAKRGLEAGEKWTDEDKAELKKQDERVMGLRKAWRDLLE